MFNLNEESAAESLFMFFSLLLFYSRTEPLSDPRSAFPCTGGESPGQSPALFPALFLGHSECSDRRKRTVGVGYSTILK